MVLPAPEAMLSLLLDFVKDKASSPSELGNCEILETTIKHIQNYQLKGNREQLEEEWKQKLIELMKELELLYPGEELNKYVLYIFLSPPIINHWLTN
jgi:hypothetical protein